MTEGTADHSKDGIQTEKQLNLFPAELPEEYPTAAETLLPNAPPNVDQATAVPNAQSPFEPGTVRIAGQPRAAAGASAIYETIRFSVRQMGIV